MFVFHRKSDPWSARQQRHVSRISEFQQTSSISLGNQTWVADALSRTPFLASIATGLDLELLAHDQQQEDLSNDLADTSLILDRVQLQGSSRRLLCDVSTGRLRPVFPSAWRRHVFHLLHDLHHPGVSTSVKIISQRFVWRNMVTDVKNWARTCIPCQMAKVHRHPKPAPSPFPIPTSRFQHVHLDLVGPLPPSNNSTYVLTIIDRFTRWPTAIPLPNSNTSTVAHAMALHWLSVFGLPEFITTDRGPQFTSALYREWSLTLGVTLRPTTSYHPQSNGLIERLHRQLKASIVARSASTNWSKHIPWILLSLRASIRPDLDAAPVELTLGSHVALPGQFWPDNNQDATSTSTKAALQTRLAFLLPTPPTVKISSEPYLPSSLSKASHVFIKRDPRKPLTSAYIGPFKVLERNSHYFTLDIAGKKDTVSLTRLKPAFLHDDNPPRTHPCANNSSSGL